MLAPEERRYAFETGTIDRGVLEELGGLEVMRRIRDGALPLAAIAQTVGFRLVEAEPGMVAFEGAPERFVYNMFGAAHGGYAATLLDSAMGCAVHTTIPRGSGYTTIDLTINYCRPVTVETGPVRAAGCCTRAGAPPPPRAGWWPSATASSWPTGSPPA
jgi:uncharacterized protein (TIGR00369 family)